ncbi:unnamed protein product [Merluccius merluccius]
MSLVNFSGQNVVEFTITGFDHLPHHKLMGTVILLAYCLALLCSGTNIFIITTDGRLHRPMYLLICNLALVDIMFSTSASTTMISALLVGDKTISYHSCLSRVYIYHLGDITECLALSLMAVDRTVAISEPLRYATILTNRRVFILIVVSWLIGIGCMGKVVSTADQLPYCQPVIKYVFCDYPAVIRAACVDPEPYFLVPNLSKGAKEESSEEDTASCSSNMSSMSQSSSCSSSSSDDDEDDDKMRRKGKGKGKLRLTKNKMKKVKKHHRADVRKRGQNVVEFTITGFDHLPHHKLMGTVILLAYCLALLCSGTNIFIISTDRRLHRPMYLLICNLALVDIMFSTSASTTMISALLAGDKTISFYSRLSHVYIFHLGDITECLALSLMALDRTVAISEPYATPTSRPTDEFSY